MADLPPLGPPAILTPPSGWLGFLGIKNGGKQPLFTQRDLQCTLDMGLFYRAGLRQLLFFSVGTANVFNGNTVALGKVPPGKVWIVDHANALSTVQGAAAGVIANLQALSAVSTALFQQGPPASQRSLTGEVISLFLDGPLIMLPGDSFSVFSTAAAAPTAFTWQGSAFGMEVSA